MVADIARKAAKPAFVVLLTDDRTQDTASATGADAMATKPTDIKAAQAMVDGFVQSQLPRRVMVVDDSATMRSIVKKILGASRFPLQLAEASEGQAALNVIARNSADIVFMDYNMPGLNGVETLKALKQSNPKVRVVIMTSAVDENVASLARDAGTDAFLKKPFYPADVDAVIYGLFGLTPLVAAKA
jgi:CheY-like chemotaxis protein